MAVLKVMHSILIALSNSSHYFLFFAIHPAITDSSVLAQMLEYICCVDIVAWSSGELRSRTSILSAVVSLRVDDLEKRETQH
jgi:hypothetical protein